MKPAPFDLHRPTTLDGAVALLAALGDDAKVLAGGQSLVPLLALRLATPGHLVDLGAVPGLAAVEEGPGVVRIGAMVRHRELATDATVARTAPLLARAARLVGHDAVRNRGTLGGSLAHADPAAEYPAACVALDADLEVVGPRGRRTVAARCFFVSTYATELDADEVLVAVSVPAARRGHGAAIREIARRSGDFALAGAACAVDVCTDGRVERAGLALFGVADRPVAAEAAEAALVGSGPEPDVVAVAALAVEHTEPADTLHATGRYLRHVAAVMAAQAIGAALAEARRG